MQLCMGERVRVCIWEHSYARICIRRHACECTCGGVRVCACVCVAIIAIAVMMVVVVAVGGGKRNVLGYGGDGVSMVTVVTRASRDGEITEVCKGTAANQVSRGYSGGKGVWGYGRARGVQGYGCDSGVGCSFGRRWNPPRLSLPHQSRALAQGQPRLRGEPSSVVRDG